MKQLMLKLPTSVLFPLIWQFILFGGLVNGQLVTFHISNKCPFPIWPAAAPNAGHPVIADGGFFLPPGQTKRVYAPPTWNGRFWARTGCNFNSTSKPVCQTGDCESLLSCNGTIGMPPATLVEVALQEDKSKPSFYDVSVVDGYNLPISVSTKPADRKCWIGGCTKSINSVCPPELQVLDQSGGIIACKSACLAFNLDVFCCRNSYGKPEKCKASMYSKMFKDACPSYFSYAYDTPSPLVNCYSKDYVITFCPSKWETHLSM
ncbi:thaumatin-like protein [Phoenix dactylifera]|uniref:Thaumatin-like protein n=1 Tax=Phoenix dactylifera TaxID=42345 RepID=A0A8B7CPB1_PHODC|nr:thaumatin-like protein [Phoenix dactylifera]